jgi:integrase
VFGRPISSIQPALQHHTVGTIQALARTNQTVIAQLIGHRSIQTTTRYIANLTQAHKNTVVDLEKNFEVLL